MERVIKESFCVLGKQGSTKDGKGFIQNLWKEANAHFEEIQQYAKLEEGKLVGLWGAMSDFTHSYLPWENNFSEGLYLAGVECVNESEVPSGWTKWTIPGYEYLVVDMNTNFMDVITYLKENDIPLVGAVHEYTNPVTQKNYLYFPIRKL